MAYLNAQIPPHTEINKSSTPHTTQYLSYKAYTVTHIIQHIIHNPLHISHVCNTKNR